MDRQELEQYIRKLQVKLRIRDWYIELTPKPELETCFVSCKAQERRAEVFYNPEDDLLKYHLAHELAHVLLYDMSYLACDGRTPDLMNAYSYLEERVCDTIADAVYEP